MRECRRTGRPLQAEDSQTLISTRGGRQQLGSQPRSPARNKYHTKAGHLPIRYPLVRSSDFPKIGFQVREEPWVTPGYRHSLSRDNRDATGHSCNGRSSGGHISSADAASDALNPPLDRSPAASPQPDRRHGCCVSKIGHRSNNNARRSPSGSASQLGQSLPRASGGL